MTAASSQITGMGFRGVQVLALNSLGIPAATTTTEYSGLRVVGAKALTVTRPEWQKIYGTGDDEVLATFHVPPQEAISGELRTGAFDMTAEALLSGIPVTTQGEGKWLPAGVNKKTLPPVCLLGWREAKSVATDDGSRAHYEAVLIPSATLEMAGGNFEERAAGERSMRVACNIVSRWPWGKALTSTDEGGTKMQVADGIFEYIPRLCAFKGDGTVLTFTFTREAVSVDKIKVFKYDGTTYTDITEDATLTVAVDDLTFSSGNAPSASTYLIVVMEVAE